MNKFFPLLLATAILLVLNGCVLPLSPLAYEIRTVSPPVNQTNTVTFKESMVWYDNAAFRTRGIQFPQGIYSLEAEDDEYFYFSAPAQIEYRIFQNGTVADDRFMPGGLFLKKASINLVPAGAYLFVDSHTNVLTWKLGASFLNMEGRRWTKNF